MSIAPHKPQVRRQFSDAAKTYARNARHQAIIAERLACLIPASGDEMQILELGCGTGLLTAHLLRRLPHARVRAIDIAPAMVAACAATWRAESRLELLEADAETYQPASTFDLVASSCVVQWFSERERLGEHLASLLKEGGRLAIAVPLAGTLGELSQSVENVTGKPMPGLDLGGAESYLRTFETDAWCNVIAEEFDVVQWYESAREVVRGVQAIGARCSGQGGAGHLSPGAMRSVIKRYELDFANRQERVPANYRVLILLAQRS